MTEQIKLTGMVISAMPVGEYDKRLVLLTTHRGKITAFSRGSRRPKSSMLAATEPFVFGEFLLIPGRDAYTLVGANVSNYFMELRENLEAACYGFYFLELASYFARENMDGTPLLKLLYQTLRILCKKIIDFKLVRRIYELKVMVAEGEYPQCFSCCMCGSSEKLTAFSFSRSGVACENCFQHNHGLKKLHPSTIYTLQYIVSSPVEKLYTFTVNDEVQRDLEQVMDHYMRLHIDRKIKSLEMLEML
ncbi:DNA repair protein RecO (recombination protein O) [Catenibacillus scindens]|uniref:DNA repair protein RecO n=1 Tax=Catenibacillus scindens TaxID=673271 RepID=A0A7W8HBJ9_9FIRM|nr:DNA repair protein RecO [Catenibacillus scindens]MBB5265339.1 DNA repair protein RecO (recombination protein O) [Catenibacillus scindens]